MRHILRHNVTLLAPTWAGWRTVMPILWVVLLLVLAPYQSLSRDLWTDEAFTISYTTYPSLTMVLDDVRKNEETPPVYFVICWLWARVVGQNEVALRLLSLMFGALAIAALAWVARRWLPSAESGMAGYLLAVLTPLGLYIVTARSYALMLLLAVICIAAFEWFFRRPEHIPALVAYSVAMGMFCLTSYFAAAFVVAHNIIWGITLLRRPEGWQRRVSRWIIAELAIALIVLPWLPALSYQFMAAKFVTSTVNISATEYFWQAYSLLAVPPSSFVWMMIWLPLTMIIWVLIIIGLRQSAKQDAGLVLRAFGVPLITQLLLIIWMQAAAWRYLTVLLPGAVLAVALGLGVLRRQTPRLGQALLVALVLGMLVYRIFGVPAPTTIRSWPELLAIVERDADPARDAVMFQPPWEQRTFEYYYRGAPLKLYGAHNYDEFFMTEGHDFSNPWTVDQASKALMGSRRAWVFYYQTNDITTLRLPYKMLDRWQSGKLELVLYDMSVAQP
jgi:dolichyl-phosphate-mannose-protein mannosyltransferase